MKFTYYGHSCFAIELQGKKVLFDPFITPNELAKNVDISSIEADYILLTHGHEDHIADCVQLANRTGAMVLSNFEVIEWLPVITNPIAHRKVVANTQNGKIHFSPTWY